ncbi:hypothetical protein BDW22DRAFT_382370 [Trametopsis cervina]|nr:hypothetical protein BDW22DRAFT_382370 [Trametopsis cervina]
MYAAASGVDSMEGRGPSRRRGPEGGDPYEPRSASGPIIAHVSASPSWRRPFHTFLPTRTTLVLAITLPPHSCWNQPRLPRNAHTRNLSPEPRSWHLYAPHTRTPCTRASLTVHYRPWERQYCMPPLKYSYSAVAIPSLRAPDYRTFRLTTSRRGATLVLRGVRYCISYGTLRHPGKVAYRFGCRDMLNLHYRYH